MQHGSPDGFTRLIDGVEKRNFIGYLDGFTYTKPGTGVLFEDFKLKNSGIFEKGIDFNKTPPAESKDFEKFNEGPN